MGKSTASKKTDKPDKPYEGFPLFPHATKRWAKKIRGKMAYFGPWDNWQAALDRYEAEKADLHAGRVPRAAGDKRVSGDTLTLRELVNRYLTEKKGKANSGEITTRTFGECYAACEQICHAFGKDRLVTDITADDFRGLRASLAEKLGPVALKNWIYRIRGVFTFAYDDNLIVSPIRYGAAFDPPAKKVLRLARAEKGPRMFEAEEIQRILKAATQPLKAMVLLGINCGFGNADCGNLPLSALNLDSGWVNYHRPKTGITRRCPLWAETVKAIREAIKERPEPKAEADAGLVFVTKYGKRWAKDRPDNPISKEIRKLLDSLGINGHRNFYALRHTFETIGGETRDQVAVDAIMGHARDDMASVYRERVGDDRLLAVTDHVHSWLFQKSANRKKS